MLDKNMYQFWSQKELYIQTVRQQATYDFLVWPIVVNACVTHEWRNDIAWKRTPYMDDSFHTMRLPANLFSNQNATKRKICAIFAFKYIHTLPKGLTSTKCPYFRRKLTTIPAVGREWS